MTQTTTRIIAAVMASMSLIGIALVATPTTLFWTPCTTQVQREESLKVGLNDYFKPGSNHHHQTPTDLYGTYGLFSYNGLGAEIGLDYQVNPANLFYANAKIALKEDTLFDWSPSLSVGVFNVGWKSRKTNEDVWDVVAGHSLPGIGGNLYAGYYIGRRHALFHHRQGWMVGYNRGFCSKQTTDGRTYDAWALAADYMSGKNRLGGGGVAIAYNFTPDVYVMTGPVWFRDTHHNGNWKWAVKIAATCF